MELELHQLELRYEGIRKRAPVAERALVGSLAEIGQQLPIIVVGEAERFILIDGYKRVRALKRLARLLRELRPEEIEIVVMFLAGSIRQGRIGIGYAAVRDAQGPPAAEPSLEIAEVDRTFQSIVETSGSRSQRQRMQLLQQMFGRATALARRRRR